ncbi:deoxyribodipyrimidine photo-lyase type I [Rhizobium sp. RU20A]|uniref:cryptochrome/photolyase family protein n=1 Tax=Rhizobium sp. RU20A TaxID=1907412 RepID=UPI000955E7DC|nr:deoxyribodipyrimidine photo-lyase [Rhizobium sp. RU20A]SIQ12020.1 deoxyribodipyrimidine photo-lyase type I [Rhizobium sp. RU20A]
MTSDKQGSAKDSGQAPVIVWFRRDLRLADNHALAAAVHTGKPVIPLYIREPDETGNGPLGAAQRWWLHHSLSALSQSLDKAGASLILRSGSADKVLADLMGQTGADAIYWNRRYEPSGTAVDGPLKDGLKADGIAVKSFAGQLMHEPLTLKTKSGGPFRVYTPFWRALEAEGEPDEPLAAPRHIKGFSGKLKSEDLADWALLPTKPDWAKTFHEVWEPGEAGAAKRLKAFVKKALAGYKVKRDFPDGETTSMLSPHLALGEISPASVWHATRGVDAPGDDIVHFRKELAWRDFSYHLLFHNPDLDRRNLQPKFDSFPWKCDDKALKRWQRGETGYPIVDAGMRQLWRHGYMHNRVRMIAASFLIKDLMIDWRVGEAWFRDTLVDADPASNAASWQWVAGSGADAAPFFRIFNPILQGEKFDPDGAYIRTFVPELAKLDARLIHRPFEAKPAELKAAGVRLGETYPTPVVDHHTARDRALEAFKSLEEPA